jgi:hypothetical protein
MKRIDSEVKQELARLGPAAAIGTVAEVWPAVVGESIAANAYPARIARDGTLHVSASSSTWAFELSQLAPQILARLQERLGSTAPNSLRFALGQVPEPAEGSRPQGTPEPLQPTPEHEAQADELVAEIGDEELREIVKKAAALSLARAAAVGPF